MANGLLGMMGQSRQPQQQQGLLGSPFAAQPTRQDIRGRMFGDIVSRYSGPDPQSRAGAAIGAGLGLGISSMLGRQLPGEERANIIRQVQEEAAQANLPLGPELVEFTATRLQELGHNDLALQALTMGQQMFPAPEMTAEQRNLMFRAEQAGLQPGTPEYEQFMGQGGLSPVPSRIREYEEARNRGLIPQDMSLREYLRTQTETGEVGQFDMSNRQREQLIESQIGVTNIVSAGQDMLNLLQESPDLNTLTARGAGVINNLRQDVAAFTRQTGIGNEEYIDEILNVGKYEDSLSDLAVDNAEFKSLAVSLAYMSLLANQPPGKRPTEADMQREIQQLGLSARDPRVLESVLNSSINRTIRNFQNRYEILTGQPFEGDFGFEESATRQQQPTPRGQPSQDGIAAQIDRAREQGILPQDHSTGRPIEVDGRTVVPLFDKNRRPAGALELSN